MASLEALSGAPSLLTKQLWDPSTEALEGRPGTLASTDLPGGSTLLPFKDVCGQGALGQPGASGLFQQEPW